MSAGVFSQVAMSELILMTRRPVGGWFFKLLHYLFLLRHDELQGPNSLLPGDRR